MRRKLQEKRRLREQGEVVEGESQKKEGGVKVVEAAQIIKLITLAAAISSARLLRLRKVRMMKKRSALNSWSLAIPFLLVWPHFLPSRSGR